MTPIPVTLPPQKVATTIAPAKTRTTNDVNHLCGGTVAVLMLVFNLCRAIC